MSNAMFSDPHVARVVDAATVTSVAAAIFGMLPTIISVLVGLMALVWYGVCLYESKTAAVWRRRRRHQKALRRRLKQRINQRQHHQL